MVELLGIVDLASFILGLTFLILAVLIRSKIKLPPNNVLIIVGAVMVVHLSVHIPKYFPNVIPQVGEEAEHIISDLTQLATALVLLWYGVTTYRYVRQVARS